MSRRVLLIGAIAILAALPLTFGTFWINMVITALIFSLAVFSVNLLTGLTGLLSFGQAGFVGIGAYTLGVLAKQGHPPILAGLYGVLLAMLCGFLLGLPAARLKGHYLAIGTLGFGILVYQLLTNSVEVTRGPMGLIGIPTGGVDKQTWYLIMLCVCLTVLAALAYIDRYSALGVILKMVRHDEIAAQASGINTFAVKLIAFTASAGLAGLSGACSPPMSGSSRPICSMSGVLSLHDDGGRGRHRQSAGRHHREPDAHHDPRRPADARRG